MKKIRVLLVGLGRIATRLEEDPLRRKPATHAGTLLSPWGRKRFQILAVSEPDNERLDDFFRQFGLEKHSGTQTSRKSVTIHSPSKTEPLPSGETLSEIDLAVIATPSESHYTIARQLIRKGVPNLLIEKPVALSLSDAKRLKEIADSQGTKIWVNHERRYHPIYAWVRQGILEDKWGKLKTIHGSVLTSALDPGRAFSGKGGGPLFHDGTHLVDYLEWLLGRPDSVQAEFHRSHPEYRLEEQVVAWLRYGNGVHVFLEVGGYRRYFQFELDIQTTQARIILSNDGFRFYEARESHLYKGFRSLVERDAFPRKLLESPNPFPRVYASIHRSITEGLPVETGSLEDNIRILETLERIQKSGKKQGKIQK